VRQARALTPPVVEDELLQNNENFEFLDSAPLDSLYFDGAGLDGDNGNAGGLPMPNQGSAAEKQDFLTDGEPFVVTPTPMDLPAPPPSPVPPPAHIPRPSAASVASSIVPSGNLEERKTALVQEYKNLIAQHPSIVREDPRVHRDASFEDVQLALIQAKNALEVAQGADFLKDGLKIGTTGLEFIAPKVSRQHVKLDGWSSEINSEIAGGKYDLVLTQIYRKHFRSGSGGGALNNPILQLMFMICTSAGIFAFKRKFEMPSNAVQPNPKPTSFAPPGADPVFQKSETQTASHAPAPASGRPKMRPPTMMPGETVGTAGGGMGDLTSIAASIAPALNNLTPMLSMVGPMLKNASS
tara:strand:+ start:1013 stop:2074 length:1062 start_codon:yes stop_codon:yes gene_type:complete